MKLSELNLPRESFTRINQPGISKSQPEQHITASSLTNPSREKKDFLSCVNSLSE